MFLKEKALSMFRHFIIILSVLLFISCEEETPTSDFVPDSFFSETEDNFVARINGINFFHKDEPTAFLTPDMDINGNTFIRAEIRFVSEDKGELVLVIPRFSTESKTYTVNSADETSRFEGFYNNADSQYETVPSTENETNFDEGTLVLTVNRVSDTERFISGTFSFSATLKDNSVSSTITTIRVLEGKIKEIQY